jgi:hypothetical protein
MPRDSSSKSRHFGVVHFGNAQGRGLIQASNSRVITNFGRASSIMRPCGKSKCRLAHFVAAMANFHKYRGHATSKKLEASFFAMVAARLRSGLLVCALDFADMRRQNFGKSRFDLASLNRVHSSAITGTKIAG